MVRALSKHSVHDISNVSLSCARGFRNTTPLYVITAKSVSNVTEVWCGKAEPVGTSQTLTKSVFLFADFPLSEKNLSNDRQIIN